jgi:hypothetical protein
MDLRTGLDATKKTRAFVRSRGGGPQYETLLLPAAYCTTAIMLSPAEGGRRARKTVCTSVPRTCGVKKDSVRATHCEEMVSRFGSPGPFSLLLACLQASSGLGLGKALLPYFREHFLRALGQRILYHPVLHQSINPIAKPKEEEK